MSEQKNTKNRLRLLHSDEYLTDEEEKNEQIAEQTAKKYGLMYFEQSCIAGKNHQFNDLVSAKSEISEHMQTGEFERPFASEREVADWLFVFYSDESNNN